MNDPSQPRQEGIAPGFNSSFRDVRLACDRFLERRGLKLTQEDYRQGEYAKVRAIMARRKRLE